MVQGGPIGNLGSTPALCLSSSLVSLLNTLLGGSTGSFIGGHHILRKKLLLKLSLSSEEVEIDLGLRGLRVQGGPTGNVDAASRSSSPLFLGCSTGRVCGVHLKASGWDSVLGVLSMSLLLCTATGAAEVEEVVAAKKMAARANAADERVNFISARFFAVGDRVDEGRFFLLDVVFVVWVTIG
ncbi:MAG: hypothetical protein J3R72DRAFT_429952 [Linnemannia gamsii]|nr:MAG: hypothetical protein J3R72DRAFT_429952 [Linnemannia gamsii]